ncbi:serine hydrolase domain-containing protein [Caulobacter mirabilis]|uniref:Serine hydrolase n=1 Tax=Caulobacter mirabilis TaxID=69666 RepID=A0A2D2AU03_9CAUL|nr:serine hydrolase domain-containing protein [Caulobacter mirabilis]ATQ41488.1 serine hydrolase [Caulobacter mirabilis]
MTKPESIGLSSERLAKIEAFLDERYVKPGKLPCAQVQVWRRGKLAYDVTLGLADRERNRALESDALFRIYSMTKPITSVAFMMLVEEGLVALDDPVAKFIPEWANLGVFAAGTDAGWAKTPPARPMLMIDLLRHTSGLTYGFQMQGNVDAAYRKLKVAEDLRYGTLQEFIDKLAGIPLVFSPGDAWNYSVSTDVLGYLVEKISGRPFPDFLEERIFQPLGMVDTSFTVPADKAHRLTACYAAGVLGSKAVKPGLPSLQDDPEKSPYLTPTDFPSGGGGLVGTAADYMRFARMLLNGGELDGVRLLGPKTLKLMTANHLPDGKDLTQMSKSLFSEATYAGVGFGLGFGVTVDPVKTMIPGSAGDFFWGGAASTFFWVDPAEDLAVVFLTQLLPSSAYPVRRELRTLVYSALTEIAE